MYPPPRIHVDLIILKMLDREFIFLILHEAMPEMLNVMNWRVVIL
jgi:hypothetical protein